MKYRLVNKEITDNYCRELLKERGIEDTEKFLHPDISCLQSQYDLDNINNGIEVIEKTIFNEKPYAIIADCDTDGICSFTIIYQYLKKINPEKKIEFFIHEGKQHGFSDLIDKLQEKDWSLIIAPDSATNDGQYIKQFQCPVLVIDHHIKEESSIIPPNMILINNQTSEKYKNKNLCGGGMVWQFCRALDDHYEKNLANEYLDLCAISIIGDMMSMLEYENQYLVQKGLSQIKNGMLKMLFEKQDYSTGGKINPTTVAFYIVPLINAMIRVGTQEEKERLYLSFIMPNVMIESRKRGSRGLLERLCVESTRECVNAKARQDREKDKMVEQLEMKIFKEDLLENQILFVELDDDDDFPPELNGLVAMNLASKYHKPTIVARLNEEGFIRGSARALSNTELASFKDYLAKTGFFEYTLGHDFAFGLSVLDKNLSKLHHQANEELSKIDFGENIYDVNFIVDSSSDKIGDIILELSNYENLWGQSCPEPQICIKNIKVKNSDLKVIGKNKDTLRLQQNGITYIKFHAKDLIDSIDGIENLILTIIGRPNINDWGGRLTPQIIITDMELEDERFAF